MQRNRIAIIGTVGVPQCYGGFETLADNLVKYHGACAHDTDLVVYCSAKAYRSQPQKYGSARLRYIDLNANGFQSIPYDVLSLIDAIRRGDTHILLLGVSGALALPLVRLFSSVRIVTNIDGIEWKREKWKGLAKTYLRLSEWAAVRFSDAVITDNPAIADYVTRTYGRASNMIQYGGDHAIEPKPDPAAVAALPPTYALAVCRIEPENNPALILEAFVGLDIPLVFVGNWDHSRFGRNLKAQYKDHHTITIHDSVYDPRALRAIRDRACMYVHGHSAGGTNPSLVEMMHFGIPVLTHGSEFNRSTTENQALYFESATELRMIAQNLEIEKSKLLGALMRDIARRRYTWVVVHKEYFDTIIGT
jgi:glycosyltransferase involved in cell wall biosynthesis